MGLCYTFNYNATSFLNIEQTGQATSIYLLFKFRKHDIKNAHGVARTINRFNRLQQLRCYFTKICVIFKCTLTCYCVFVTLKFFV